MNFVTVFASIGLVFVIMYVFWYIMNRIKQSNENVTTNEISANYMNQIGLRCPDYYVNTENNGDINTCKNSYNLDHNIDVEGESDSNDPRCSNIKCYHDLNEKTVNFQKINNWQDLNNDERINALKDDGKNMDNVTNRCDWIKCCGVSVGNSSTSQPWLEINDYCNSVSSIN